MIKYFLQATTGIEHSSLLFFGAIGMVMLAAGLVLFIVFHQRKILRYQAKIQQLEAEHQQILLKASIKLQEDERSRLAADLHDDAGPLLATARLYLSENLVNMDKASQLQSIYNAKQIIDETIQLIRNLSHSLMPPTLKNFGLESAVNDFFNKINNSGSINVNSRFRDYKDRLPAETELIVFRIIQELINNILKHSHASFIHLTQHDGDERMIIRLHHDGKGLTQQEFVRFTTTKDGLGLKNIQSRLKVIDSDILFEEDATESMYKISLYIPKAKV